MLKFILKFSTKLLAAFLLFLSVGTFVVMSSANTMNNRDFDAAIGLLKRPLKTASHFFKPVNAEALTVTCTNCDQLIAAEKRWSIEKILNELLRKVVMDFVKGLLQFLQQQFLALLEKIEQWAEAMFGIRLNLCNVKRFIGIQSFVLEARAEVGLNSWFDGWLGPLSEVTNQAQNIQTDQAAANAVRGGSGLNAITDPGVQEIAKTLANSGYVARLNAAMQEADKRYPQCSNNGVSQALPSEETIVQVVSESMNNLSKGLCEAKHLTLAQGDPITFTAIGVVDKSCPTAAAEVSESIQKLNEQVQKSKENAAKSIENADKKAPADCPESIYLDNNGGNLDISGRELDLGASIADSGQAGSFGFLGSTSILQSAIQVVGDKTVTAIDQNGCQAGSIVDFTRDAIKSAATSTNAPQSESLLDALWGIIQDFLNQLFEKLKEIITNLLNEILNKFKQLFSSISGGYLSSVLDQLGTAGISLVEDGINSIQDSVNKQISALRGGGGD